MDTGALVWDNLGYRHLCPADNLKNLNFVDADELESCIDHDTRLKSRRTVPSNDPKGRIRFTKSVSPN